MKRLLQRISLAVLAVAFSATVVARDITLAWDASPSEDVVRYVVAVGTNDGGPYPQQWPVPRRENTTLMLNELSPGRYFFVAYAVNSSNLWSDASNQVEVSIPEPPKLVLVQHPSVSLTGVVYRATNVLGPWEEFVRLPPVSVPFDGEMGFFRLGLEWSPPRMEMNQ